MEGLFGQDFEINISKSKPDVKTLVSKTKKAKKETDVEADAAKLLKSKKLSLQERLSIIKENVLKTLGRQIDNVVVIRDLGTFSAYIDKAIEKGIIAAPQKAALPQNLELDENPHLFNKMGIIPYQPHQAPRGSIRMASSTLPGLDGFHRDAETSGKHFLGQARAVTDLLDLDRGKCIEFFDSTTMDNYFRLLALGSVKELVEGRRDVIVHFGHYGSSFRAGAYNMAQWL